MRKRICKILILFCCGILFAQKNNTVDLNEEIYSVLKTAETKGLCSSLSNVKPYSENYILTKLNEIEISLNEKEMTYSVKQELETVKFYKNKYTHKPGLDLLNQNYRKENNNSDFKTSFEFQNKIQGFFSMGLYKDSKMNSKGYEVWDQFIFCGDLGNNFSYNVISYFEFTKIPLVLMGNDYYIGNWWYSTHDQKVTEYKENVDGKYPTIPRTVKTYRNYSLLPYSYKKHWDGSIYFLGNITGNGLESWPGTDSFGFGMCGEINGSWFNDKVQLNIGRVNHEWAAMDNGSSLVLNSRAQPFFGIDLNVDVFDCLSFSTITGSMEFPNQRHINYDAWYLTDEEWSSYYELPGVEEKDPGFVKGASPGIVDSYFFQNFLSIGMVTFNTKYLMIDFGSSCIYPKRFELGYAFPLIDRIVYQNNLGDYDNLQVFGDLKLKYPGVGSLWFSLFMDELYNPKQLFDHARSPFVFQTGTNVAVPVLAFSSASLRYTKVEPFCYTHAATKVPWYKYYISTSYTNNGESLGYYLPPNSDEILLKFNTKPTAYSTAGIQFQFMRHGTDWGSGSVEGSNIYSELVPRSDDRQKKMKYFLYDGTYEWMTVVSVNGSYNFKKYGIPCELCLTAGYVWDWFTGVEKNGQKNNSYHKIKSAEYPEMNGLIITVGFKLFNF